MSNQKYKCPCCGYLTLEAMGDYDICPVCFWEDDPYQAGHPDAAGGANRLSLKESRENYIKFGACEERFLCHVRKPKEEETEENA